MGVSVFAAMTLASAAIGEAAAPALEGVDWQLQQYRVADALQDAVDGKDPAVLRFDDGRVSGSAGCNRLLGAYRLGDGQLRFEPRTAATMMACPSPLMDQEQAVFEAMGQAATYRIDAGSLHIASADGQPLLRFTERKGLPLIGTSWRLTWYNNGRQAIVSVLEDSAFMLELGDDGQLEGKACNRYRAGFEHDDRLFRLVGPIAATRAACSQPQGIVEQEGAYFAVLERVAGFRISDDELTLTDTDGVTMARFKAD